MSTSSSSGRRTFIKGIAATMALRPGLLLAGTAMEDTLALREPLVIARADLDSSEGSLKFDAWFRWNNRDRLVGGLLLDLSRMLPSASTAESPEPAVVAYVSNCPHEACKVRLESDHEIINRAAIGVSVPAGPVLLCPCHFSLFDPKKGGSRLIGPAYRGLYRFALAEHDGSIIIERVERAVVELFG